jgi:RNA polymerase sigma-70 factor (ECF subfamily)
MPEPECDPEPRGELDLMRRIASGDAASFHTLVETHHRSILCLGLRLLRDQGEAEDLCQDVFFQALRKASTFKGSGSLRGWIFRIAANLACNRLRRPSLLPARAHNDEASPAPNPASAMEEEKAAAVRAAIASLPERQRLAVVLLRYEGLTYREIAEALDARLPAVESLIHRAHKALREKLRKYSE